MYGVPLITDQLAAAEGGLPEVIAALSSSDDPDAQAFIAKLNRVSASDRERISIEHVAVAARVPTLRLLEIATSSLVRRGLNVSKIIAATAHPKVVEKTVQMALQDKGIQDRKMLHEATGFLPTNKGGILVNRIQIANLREPEKPDQEVEVTANMPTFESDIGEFQETYQKMLKA